MIRFNVNTVVNHNYLQSWVSRALPSAHAQNQRVAIDGPEWGTELNDNYRGLIESVINQCSDRAMSHALKRGCAGGVTG